MTGVSSTPPALRRDRAFTAFVTARSLTVAGHAFTGVALPVLVLEATGSAWVTAAVSAVEVVPYLLFGLVAGAVADRADRRRLMITSHLVAAVALLSVPVAHAAGALTVGHVLAAAAVTSTCFVWFDAAAFGALPTLVGRERLAAANSAVWTSATLLDVAVPALAGVAVATIGPAMTVGADGVSYVCAAALLWLVPTARLSSPAPAPDTASRATARSTLRDVCEGLAYVRHQPVVRTLTTVGFGNSVTGGAVTALLVVYATQALGMSTQDRGIGLLHAAVALGALAAALALPWLTRRLPGGWITIGSLTANPVALLVVAWAPGPATALPALAVWSAAWTLTILNGITARQALTPDHLQSRVGTTARMIAWGGTPFGALLGGALAQAMSVRAAYAVVPVAVAVSAVAAWRGPLRARTAFVATPRTPSTSAPPDPPGAVHGRDAVDARP